MNELLEKVYAYNRKKKAFEIKAAVDADMAADFRKLLDLIPPSIIKLLEKDKARAELLSKYLGGRDGR